jgi:hypothetical protein
MTIIPDRRSYAISIRAYTSRHNTFQPLLDGPQASLTLSPLSFEILTRTDRHCFPGGANAEGTEAAGKLVTELPRSTAVLKGCGISPTGPLRYFELLLRLNMMASSPTNVNVEACHILSGNPIH